MRSLVGDAFPELWFELPLLGDPWFDLHVLTDRSTLSPGMSFTAYETGGYPETFAWFSGSRNTRQLSLSWDVGAGRLDCPAIQLLLSDTDAETACEFLASAGRAELGDAYRVFVQRIPRQWFACYAGVFPQRPGIGLRVECVFKRDVQDAYVQDPSLLERHLRAAGFTAISDALLECCAKMVKLPFNLEFQFDVLPDGSAGATLGVSLRFNSPWVPSEWKAFSTDGEAGELMRALESRGLVDDRWRLLEGTAFAKRLSLGDESVSFFCYPAFVKLRWVDGAPLDVKTYLVAGAR